MAACTRARVSGRSSSGLFRAFETVCRETPATSATVASVGALLPASVRRDIVYNAVAGLGGRPVTRASLRGLVDDVLASRVDPNRLHLLDLDTALVERELARPSGTRPGPHAENMLRGLGIVGSGSH